MSNGYSGNSSNRLSDRDWANVWDIKIARNDTHTTEQEKQK